MFDYPVDLQADENGGYVVGFPDFPYGVTEGEDREDALARAVDALETIIIGLIGDRAPVPAPSPAVGRLTVTLPTLSAAKVALYQAMQTAGVRKAELARRLGWHMPQVDRLLDLRHASRMDQIETALLVLGKRLEVGVRDAA